MHADVPAPASAPVAEKTSVPASNEIQWEDDSILRAYAQDARDGTTNWVMAGDLCELYANVAAFNRGLPEQNHVRVEIATPIANNLRDVRDRNLHDPSKNGMNDHKGPLVLKGETMLKALGPTVLEGVRFNLNGTFVQATYFNDGFETGLALQNPDGDDQIVIFKGGSHRKYTQTPSLLPLLK